MPRGEKLLPTKTNPSKTWQENQFYEWLRHDAIVAYENNEESEKGTSWLEGPLAELDIIRMV